MELLNEKQQKAYEALKERFGYRNRMQTPRLQKIVVSVGIGSTKDKHKVELIESRLAKITGQKPALRPAKKSIASFKSREGDPVGYQVTLRGVRMADFFNRLINAALPRTKDFKGVSRGSGDAMGNYTLGIREHTIFPETADEDIKDVFGLAVTLQTSAKSKEEAAAYLEHLGLPFRK